MGKFSRRLGVLLTVLLGLYLIVSGVFTIVGNEMVNAVFESVNLTYMQVPIGIGKIVSAILFLIPATFLIGVLLLSAFWGGAIVTHLALGDPIWLQAGLLVLTWIILALRKPMHFIR